ncbi:hypothetical protein [Streptomyces sp. NPDC091215]|uniref:hypothetical protein n=1 Tax=Streptomyces sp. NPDC091215 TaxID=3155192 RepID=UPI00342DD7E5
MADIQLVDVSLRDGNQSLWSATGLDTGKLLQIAPFLDRKASAPSTPPPAPTWAWRCAPTVRTRGSASG